MGTADSIILCLLAVVIFIVLLLVYQLCYTLYTDDFRFFERLPGFHGLCRFGQAMDHHFFAHFGHVKHRMEQTCSSASDLDDECSTLSDGGGAGEADPEHGEYKTRWRDPGSLFADGDTARERRRARRSAV